MPAERSVRLALSPDWADGWCRTAAAPSESRNPELADRIRIPALRTAPTCPVCEGTKARREAQFRQTQASQPHAQPQTKEAATPERTAANRRPSASNEHRTTAGHHLSNSFILSEVRKALRHHPEATTAIRIHFDELADRLEAEGAGPQERERRAA